MHIITYLYLTILLILIIYCMIIIGRILPLIIYVRQPLPFVPIPDRRAKQIAQLPELANVKTIIDLGCGTGTLLKALHRYGPKAALTGLEYKPNLLRWARWRAHFWKPQPTFVLADLFQYDVSTFDAVVGFWISELAPKLVEKFVAECKPGCIIVSYLFPLPLHPKLKLNTAQPDQVYSYTVL